MAPKKTTKKAAPKEVVADPEALRNAFKSFDLDGDGALSREELISVLTKPTASVGGKPFDSEEAVTEADKVIKKFDTNGDSKLQYDEFISWLVEKTGSKAAGEELKRLRDEKADAAFARYDKGGKGGLKKGELAQIIKDANEAYGFLSDAEFPAFIKQAWADAQPDDENLVRPEPFRTWHASFVDYFEQVKAKDAAEAAAAAEAKAKNAAVAFGGDGLWHVDLKGLQDALTAAWAKGKTPLLVDATNDQGGFSALETYYSYSGHQLLELKKMVVEVNMKKEKTVEEALDEARAKLVLSMKRGLNLVMLLSNSAPPLKSKFTSPTQLPYTLLEDNAAVAKVSGDGAVPMDGTWAAKVVTDKDQVVFVHKDFQVVAVTKFGEEDYAQFLAAELPLDKMQHIKVTTQS